MRLRALQWVIGVVLALFSVSFLPSALISWYYGDGQVAVFLLSAVTVLAAGALLWFPVRKVTHDLTVADGFLTVVLSWLLLGVAGSLPFMLGLHLSFTDAVFEAV